MNLPEYTTKELLITSNAILPKGNPSPNLHRQGTQHINSERPQIRVVTSDREKPAYGSCSMIVCLIH